MCGCIINLYIYKYIKHRFLLIKHLNIKIKISQIKIFLNNKNIKKFSNIKNLHTKKKK